MSSTRESSRLCAVWARALFSPMPIRSRCRFRHSGPIHGNRRRDVVNNGPQSRDLPNRAIFDPAQTAYRMGVSSMGMNMGPLVTTAWLAEELGKPDLVVFDATKYLPN